MTDLTPDISSASPSAAAERFFEYAGLRLNFAVFGDISQPPVLLLMGLATQRTAWPQAWIDALLAKGRCVITMDNRDCGLSTRFDHIPAPNPASVAFKKRLGIKTELAYELSDMALDAKALLQHLQLASVDVVGVSMGGMIAQWLALIAPTQVRRLNLIMTSSGYPWLPMPHWKVLRLFTQRVSGGDAREAAVRYLMSLFALIGSPGFPTPPERLRLWAEQQSARSFAGSGAARQLAAIIADDLRYQRLHELKMPVRIMHGDADLLVPLAHGQDLAKRISQATLRVVPGLGHDLPESLAPIIAEWCFDE